jgi:DNA (cytosine-5)-methyltransferase 1
MCGADDNQGQASHLIARGLTAERGQRNNGTEQNLLIAFHQIQDPITSVDFAPSLGAKSNGMGVAFPLLEVGARTGKSTDDERCGLGIGDGGDPMFTLQASKQHGVAFSENQRGEVLETEYARQLSAGGGKPGQGYPAVRQDMTVRRLTPLECERLQGFPDNWTACLSDSARYRTLGNAVAVPVAEYIGTQLIRHLGAVECLTSPTRP